MKGTPSRARLIELRQRWKSGTPPRTGLINHLIIHSDSHYTFTVIDAHFLLNHHIVLKRDSVSCNSAIPNSHVNLIW